MTTVNHSAAAGVHPAALIASSDPGAPAGGAGVLWIDTSTSAPFTIWKRNAGNTGWDICGYSSAQEVVGKDLKAAGSTGAASQARLIGANSAGAPASGTWVQGDIAVDYTGKMFICTAGGTPGTWVQTGGGSGLFSAYLCYQDQKASGTNGGTFTSGAWQKRDLNTEVADTGNHGSVASNQITLDAGTYVVQASAPAHFVNSHQIRLRDTTNSVTLATGSSEWTSTASGNPQSTSRLMGFFTLAGSAVLELQHQCSATRTPDGLGVACSFGTEVYAQIEFFKE